jgi:isoleucyl-tRNA synthetase
LAGHAREVVRFIQERRKSDGLEISDRISIVWNASTEIISAIDIHSLHIQEEVLAISMVRDETLTINESEFGLTVVLTKAL